MNTVVAPKPNFDTQGEQSEQARVDALVATAPAAVTTSVATD